MKGIGERYGENNCSDLLKITHVRGLSVGISVDLSVGLSFSYRPASPSSSFF